MWLLIILMLYGLVFFMGVCQWGKGIAIIHTLILWRTRF